MKCPKCNQEIEDGSVFCEYCGEKISSIEKEPEKDNDNEAADNIAKPWYRRKWALPTGIVLAVAIVSVIVINLTSVKALMGDAEANRIMGDKYYRQGKYGKSYVSYLRAAGRDYYSTVVFACAWLDCDKLKELNRSALSDYLRSVKCTVPYCENGILYLKYAAEFDAIPVDDWDLIHEIDLNINSLLGDIYAGNYGSDCIDEEKAMYYYDQARQDYSSDPQSAGFWYAQAKYCELEKRLVVDTVAVVE